MTHLCRRKQYIAAREVMKVAYEILKSIVDAEAQAVEKKRQANAEAEQMKADAKVQSAALLDSTRKEGLRVIDDAVARAVEDSVVTIQGIRRDAQEACSEIRSQAPGKKEKAIQAVIGKVVGTYGSC